MRRLPATYATVVLLTLLFPALSCSKQAQLPSAPPQVSQVRLQEPGSVPASEPPAAVQPRKLVRTAYLSIEVEDPTDVANGAEVRTTEVGGYIARRNSYSWNESRRYDLELRIPNETLAPFVAELTAQALEIEREELRTEDVTATFVDARARLGALEATEKELLALLGESRARGDKAAEIMAVFRELTDIRSRIEQIQGQLKLLQNQTTFATLHLSLTPPRGASVFANGWKPIETLKGSLGTLLRGLRVLGDLAIYLLVVALPLTLLIGAPVWWAAKQLRRRWGSRARTQSGEPDDVNATET